MISIKTDSYKINLKIIINQNGFLIWYQRVQECIKI